MEEIKNLLEYKRMKAKPIRTYGTQQRRKLITMSVYVKNTKRSHITDLMLHAKVIEKQEQSKPRTSRSREIIKIRT
jgi:hypothetical protein